MTTAAQVKRALRPLLERHGDLALVGRLLVVKPLRHLLRGILIDRRRGADDFNPQWFVVHLFEPRRSYPLSWGKELFRRSHGLWRWSHPESRCVLLEEIELHALPPLRTMQTLDDFVAFVAKHQFRHHLFDWPHVKVVVDVALGDLESARSICVDKIAGWSEATYGRDEEDKAQLRRLKELCARLAANDRQGLARQLHEWEAITVRNLKLEHLWEPTPFPLEQQDARG